MTVGKQREKILPVRKKQAVGAANSNQTSWIVTNPPEANSLPHPN
jgi:hypothetical protein